MNLEVLAGYTRWGGDDPDRFLTVEDRLVPTTPPGRHGPLDQLYRAGVERNR
ncbi:hypothetical protein EV384_2457 [Micromonospora kangleipakensis]|uniref:Uncharacterized protein n=1 Tax=Micromonospora kangleipakensis TaxID=1077942 RepID=A0A4Q8B958_9ACTN|nr:hypothetical protein EV384_2457 [Micromonospora kangleipakensis]